MTATGAGTLYQQQGVDRVVSILGLFKAIRKGGDPGRPFLMNELI